MSTNISTAEIASNDPGGYLEEPFVAEAYEYIASYRRRPDIDFYVELARQVGGPVLELGCGTGRVLLPTARSGIAITGVEYADLMFKRCETLVAAEPAPTRQKVRLVRGDIRAFDVGGSFSLVTLPFRPLQHLITVDDQMSALRCVNRHLPLGGHLAFDVFNPSLSALLQASSSPTSETPFEMPGGRTVIRSHRRLGTDHARQTVNSEIAYEIKSASGSHVIRHAYTLRYFFAWELVNLLTACGFSTEAMYGDFDKRSYVEGGGKQIVIVARKTGDVSP